MSQLVTWRVMIGKGISMGHVRTYLYQSQLTIWRVSAQNYVKDCVPSIIHGQSHVDKIMDGYVDALECRIV